MFKLESERLILREFELTDSLFVLQLLNTKGWLDFIGDRGVKNEQDARNYIEDRLMPSYTTNGYGFYLVKLKGNNIPIGMCGVVKRDTLEHTDLGFAFMPPYIGKGYAYEASIACLQLAKNKFGLKHIAAITVPTNSSSINLLKKLDFTFDKIIKMENDEEELMLFEREI